MEIYLLNLGNNAGVVWCGVVWCGVELYTAIIFMSSSFLIVFGNYITTFILSITRANLIHIYLLIFRFMVLSYTLSQNFHAFRERKESHS